MAGSINFDALRCCSLFYNLEDESLKAMISSFEMVELPKGGYLFDQGDHGEAFYIIMSGNVVLSRKNKDGSKLKVAELGTGDVFGEMSLINNAPRSTDCVASEDVKLWKLQRKRFAAFETTCIDAYTGVIVNIIRVLAERLSLTNSRVANLLDEIAAADARKEDIAKRVEMNRSGLVRFLAGLGG
jgi:CRP-like cAMP-binding protein